MSDENATQGADRPKAPLWQRTLPWLITVACFSYLYSRVNAQAAREGQTAVEFLLAVFANVSWGRWLALMIPYSAFFFLIDSLVVWRVVNWFNARVRYVDILPIRGSTYILSIINEQIGKGAMALYLNRRDHVPGWQVGSSMLFIMFCEFFYLLAWALVGVTIGWDRFPEIFHWIPWIALAAAGFFAVWLLYFAGVIAPRSKLRDRQILHAFRSAKLWQYGVIVLLRSPALITAVFVYTTALGLFGVEVGYPVSRPPSRDDRVRPRPAQLLHLLQRGDRPAVLEARKPGDPGLAGEAFGFPLRRRASSALTGWRILRIRLAASEPLRL